MCRPLRTSVCGLAQIIPDKDLRLRVGESSCLIESISHWQPQPELPADMAHAQGETRIPDLSMLYTTYGRELRF